MIDLLSRSVTEKCNKEVSERKFKLMNEQLESLCFANEGFVPFSGLFIQTYYKFKSALVFEFN